MNKYQESETWRLTSHVRPLMDNVLNLAGPCFMIALTNSRSMTCHLLSLMFLMLKDAVWSCVSNAPYFLKIVYKADMVSQSLVDKWHKRKHVDKPEHDDQRIDKSLPSPDNSQTTSSTIEHQHTHSSYLRFSARQSVGNINDQWCSENWRWPHIDSSEGHPRFRFEGYEALVSKTLKWRDESICTDLKLPCAFVNWRNVR